MSNSSTPALSDQVNERWLAALHEFQPGLPHPVALAMVETTAKGNLGSQLRVIEQALMNFESANFDELTGSEARVLIAILRQMHNELSALENRLNHLWEYK